MNEPQLRVVSYGTVHGGLPADIVPDIMVNVSDWFRDPHIDPELRELTGLDSRVVNKVLSTDGVYTLLNQLVAMSVLLANQKIRTVTVAIGCVGGRHRSVVIADVLGLRLSTSYAVQVDHLHIDRPVTRRGEA